MKLEVWANLFSAIGTVAAAAVAAYSARLAWRQVGFQFVPRLIVRSEQFQIRTAGSIKDDFFWSKPGEDARFENGGSEEYQFTLLNVGNAPAFDVRIYVEMEYPAIYDDVLTKLEPYIDGLTVSYDDFGCQVRIQDELIGGFRLPDQAFGIVNMIGGASTTDREKTFIIDPNLSFFATCYAHYLRLAHESVENAQKPQMIPLTFRIQYLDGSANRSETTWPMQLVVRGGRYKSDGTDGVSIISIAPRN